MPSSPKSSGLHLRLGGSRSIFVTTHSGYFSRLGAGARRVDKAPLVSASAARCLHRGPLRYHTKGGRYGTAAGGRYGTTLAEAATVPR